MGRDAVLAVVVALTLSAAAPAARAVDGCVVLLCLAGNWSQIPQCVPPVQQLFTDMALGGSFPSCALASAPSIPATAPVLSSAAGGVASQTNAIAASSTALTRANCPAQFAMHLGRFFSCSGYAGAVSVSVNGALWSQTLWSASGKSVTCYSSAASTALNLSGTTCSLP